MKTLKLFSLAAFTLAISTVAVAQTKTETFKVSGNCGMCKTKIEKAAKEAGAKDATWNADTKDLTVSYKSSTTNAAKIQSKIAEVGYDNVGFKATNEAYNKLHGCCKYDRAAVTAKKEACCSDEASCKHGDHEGMAKHEGMDKHEGMAKADCCKDGKCTKEGHDGKDCCTKMDAKKMDCCKDGKCSMPGHDGKDCCKKS